MNTTVPLWIVVYTSGGKWRCDGPFTMEAEAKDVVKAFKRGQTYRGKAHTNIQTVQIEAKS